ncbi:Branched-chain amino acid transport system permease protein LivM [Castellaniella defragrans 65Phen]|jgi:branched-chain amino acid transport system permease protein|uniref:Branched-chain amino acid transport system permease protein LivM n=2 Tax=Castellaniella defragrans TaxID=75697 RepID=W8X2W4_CASD6|nr:branched-chain amino acid ABC transporter permease [Castellaniella defragrans]KAB0603693.1 branched-chain amino acid ABC transporter permease [Castellaniella defragrans]MBB6082920.1 branched-chain amino acid transport system permease protein [Castellaniella defragrans]CDM23812.1 Branched-chain amino acid transport system permease protein LivM [Castellaniella defragrans 65Phen]
MKSIHATTLLALLALLLFVPPYLPTTLVNAGIQMLIAALFATAFNVLAGQGGMLSFGHSAYFAIGTFATIHAMNAVEAIAGFPTPLLPLAGFVGGGLLGVAAGWFSTQRSGVYFAMVTLALAELLHALAPHLSGIFGGEGGVSAMRMPAWGLTFGSSIEVYYLTLFWAALGIALLYYFTRTPLGRLCEGLRENTHRLGFLGYDVHRLRLMVFTISAAFSGLAGALLAMSNEAANYVLFDMNLSAQVVLNAYIGGIGAFFGPALGAAVMTFFGYAVSDLTRTWLLYQGVIFVLVMMFMPAGLFSIGRWWRTHRDRHSPGRLGAVFAGWACGCLLAAAGLVFLVEMLAVVLAQDYQSLLVAGQPWPAVALFGLNLRPGQFLVWLAPLLLIALGVVWVLWVGRRWAALREEYAS